MVEKRGVMCVHIVLLPQICAWRLFSAGETLVAPTTLRFVILIHHLTFLIYHPTMAAQPDFNQLAQNYQGIANQISLFPNLPAIANQEAIWDEFRRRDEQAATRPR